VADAKYLLSEIDFTEHKLGTIIPMATKEYIKLGEQGINKFLTSFSYEQLVNDDDIRFFDYLFIEDEQMNKVLVGLLESLKILYRTDKVSFDADESGNINILISDANINRDNFDVLCKIVRDMFFISVKKEDDEPKVYQVREENKAILEEYLRLEQEAKKEQEELNKKNQKSLHQIVTIVASKCLWDFDKVMNMTYYRLIVCYMSIFEIENYTTYMDYVTSGQFDMKNQTQKHWSELVGK
jgi:hypothetical protein